MTAARIRHGHWADVAPSDKRVSHAEQQDVQIEVGNPTRCEVCRLVVAVVAAPFLLISVLAALTRIFN